MDRGMRLYPTWKKDKGVLRCKAVMEEAVWIAPVTPSQDSSPMNAHPAATLRAFLRPLLAVRSAGNETL